MFGSRRSNIDEVIAANLDGLVRFAYFRTGERAEAEDIVYEAVLRLLESHGKISNAKCYLFRIVYNLCQDQWRHRRIETVPLDAIDVPDQADEELDKAEIDRINHLLDGLPPIGAEIVRMNVVDELSFVEIGHILGLPQSTVKSRFYAAMRKLRAEYYNNNQ
ncbi:MAG: RNA polymerase sigma factor [Muribaculaceae bacterium]|nr:RNA polymerase sigma factor [Muribaculaceae bacterium]